MAGVLCSMVGATFSVAAAAEIIRVKKGITAIGNAQVDTAQSKFGGSSALFDGSGDYLIASPNNGLAFGTGDFTIECWFRLPNTGSFRTIYTAGSSNGGNITVYVNNTDIEIHQFGGGYSEAPGGIFEATSLTINTNTWYHFALTRSSSTSRIFLDGVLKATLSNDTHNWSLATEPKIGYDGYSTDYWNGHIDEFRISNTARYTENFTPATTPFVNDNNTLLLIHADGTDASTFFEDDNGVVPFSTRTAKTVTAIGNAQVDTAQSKFGSSSALFDGNGDWINSSGDFTFTGNFTIEFWIRFAAVGSSSRGLATDRPAGTSGYSTNNWYIEKNTSDGFFAGVRTAGGDLDIVTANSLVTTNTWYHVAFVRSGSTISFYLDGTSRGTPITYSGTVGDGDITFGAINTFYLNGWIDEVRVSNVARYTANFTAPTAPFASDANTLLLLHMEGADASTTFTDDVFGVRTQKGIISNSVQVSTVQSKFGGTSGAFAASRDLVVNNFSTDSITEFTWEAWIYITDKSTETGADILMAGTSSGVQDYNRVLLSYAENRVYCAIGSAANSGWGVYWTWNPSINTWYHLAFTRDSSNVIRAFVDGTALSGTFTRSYAFLDNQSTITIGKFRTNTSYFRGYIDEYRISNTARYTSNFTAPTAPFVNDANTLLLIHADGTNASTVFRDDNGTSQRVAKHISYYGNAQIDTAQSKFGGASLLGDGTGDYLQLETYTDLSLSGDFTLECWYRIPGSVPAILPFYNSDHLFYLTNDGGTAKYAVFQGGSNRLLTSGVTVSSNTWYHVAFVRSGTTLTAYHNGTSAGSSTWAGTISATTPTIGSYSSYFLNGWIDEFRISNSARYTANFTAPTAPFTNDANTVLLLHFNGADAATTFVDDNGGRASRGIIANGNAQIDTAQSNFGGASALFDGTGDFLRVYDLPALGTGDFTIEFWARWNSVNNSFLLDPRTSVNGPFPTISYFSGLYYYVDGANRITGSTVSTGVWYHIAVSRSGTSTRMFINGTQTGSTYTDSTNYTATSYTTIGANGTDGGTGFNGWIDEFRISNIARYTANFTPSTTPFSNDTNTLLLLHMDGTDASTVFFDDNGQTPQTP